MKNRIIMLTVALATAALISACGGGATNVTVNANKPANTNTAANTAANTASNTANTNTASSNTNADKNEAGNPDLDFTLVNGTGYDIKVIMVGPTGDKNWTKDDEVDLKGKEFKDKDTLAIKFHPKEKAQNWDLRVEWSDGDTPVEWLNLDLTKIEKITLKYDKASGKTTALTE